MQGLWLSVGRVGEVWMCRAKVSGELVQSVASNKDTGRDVQHAVFGIFIGAVPNKKVPPVTSEICGAGGQILVQMVNLWSNWLFA